MRHRKVSTREFANLSEFRKVRASGPHLEPGAEVRAVGAQAGLRRAEHPGQLAGERRDAALQQPVDVNQEVVQADEQQAAKGRWAGRRVEERPGEHHACSRGRCACEQRPRLARRPAAGKRLRGGTHRGVRWRWGRSSSSSGSRGRSSGRRGSGSPACIRPSGWRGTVRTWWRCPRRRRLVSVSAHPPRSDLKTIPTLHRARSAGHSPSAHITARLKYE